MSTTVNHLPDFPLAGARRAAFAGGVVMLALLVVLGLYEPGLFFRSYLVAYLAWLGLPLGCLALTMVYHLTGGQWGTVLRQIWAAALRTLPLLALLFLPLLLGLTELYPWARPDEVARDDALQAQQFYLNVPFFLGRAALYFLTWLILAHLLDRWSSETKPDRQSRLRQLSAPGLLLLGVTVTFAAIDWAMSLEPHWFSSIYGVVFASGQLLAALAFAVLTAALFHGALTGAVLRDLGNLLLTFTLLWAYVSFSQLLVIWSGNLPEELPWYVRRLEGGWEWVALGLLLFQFVVPFLLLLSRTVKGNPRSLAAVAGLILGMRFVDLWWTIAPAFPASDWRGLDLVAMFGLGGIWLGAVLGQLRRTLPPRRASDGDSEPRSGLGTV